MNRPLSYLERAEFLATVKTMGEGDEIAEASFDLMVDIESRIPAPWAESDPFVAERYLADRGASPTAATRNAAEFEVKFRALYGLSTGRPAETFQDLTSWINTHVDGGA